MLVFPAFSHFVELFQRIHGRFSGGILGFLETIARQASFSCGKRGFCGRVFADCGSAFDIRGWWTVGTNDFQTSWTFE
jgi:hypothetical protein